MFNPTEATIDLQNWLWMWTALGAEDSPRLRDLRAELIDRYSEPHRHYHTVQHLSECLERWPNVRDHSAHPSEVEAAIWFHDVVYDTHRSDNEEQSARLAEESLLGLGVSEAAAERVHRLIMFTQHASQPEGADAQAVVDVDLWILAADPVRFHQYERQIRQEYAWVPEQEFRKRRAAILRHFLERPAIYSTPAFRERYEAQARANLRTSLDRLQ